MQAVAQKSLQCAAYDFFALFGGNEIADRDRPGRRFNGGYDA
jgi:hypothetical protein